MKRIVSIILSLVIIMASVMSVPLCVSAITIEELQSEAALNYDVTTFDFEEEGVIKVGSQSLRDDKVTYRVDAENTLSYYYSGWGFTHIADNPIKTATSAENSIVNNSNKVLGAIKTGYDGAYNTYGTGGGFVINTQNALGTKPYILENNTTYTVEFDYLIKSTHLYGDVTKPDGTTITISPDEIEKLSIGYGYKENTDANLSAVAGFNTSIATVASYTPTRDKDGTFTAYDGVKEVGNWYHFSYTFKTGSMESIYSTSNAPFLILYVNMFTGTEIYLDNFSVGKTETNSAFFDYEDKEHMYVTTYMADSEKSTWQYSPTNTIEYYTSGWGFSSISSNLVKENDGVSGSVNNSSAKAMQAIKTAVNNYGTSGGIVINRKTDKGVEALVLEEKTTYTVEFDYLVYQTHSTSLANETSKISFGYGYKITDEQGYAPVGAPVQEVATIASYKPSRDADGKFYEEVNGVTKDVGSWYHQSHTFTTGTFTSVTEEYTTDSNAPFLMFYAMLFTGDRFMIDNIRITKHVSITLNANGGTVSNSSYSGVIGDTLRLPTPSRMGYEFTGWYKDSACTDPFTDIQLSNDNVGKTIYAGWKMGIESFENNYSGTGKGTYFSTSTDQAYTGSCSMKYYYNASYDYYRTRKNNYFPIIKLENNGETSTTYKLTFRYYIGSVNMYVQPALVKNTSNSTDITTLGSQVILYSSDTGRWQTISMIFTVTNSNLSTYPNLAIYAYAASNTKTPTYFDDFEIVEVPIIDDVTSKTGSLTISSKSVGLVNGDVIDNGFAYNNGYAVEGWYKDSALTQKIVANVYTTDTTNAYPKFSDRVDLTANGITSLGKSYKHTGDFNEANYNDRLSYSGATGIGTAKLVNTSAGSYMVEFLYKNNGNLDVTVNDSLVLTPSKEDKWYKGYVPVTLTATGDITLSLSGKSAVEIKDVYIKNLGSDVFYVIFDSTEFGGEISCVYGTAGSNLTLASAPIVEGKWFDGWYNGDQKFEGETFPNSSVILKAKMKVAGEKAIGDCNGDGICNAVDVADMKLYLAKINVKIADGADMNDDGKVNAIDLVLLSRKLAGY